MSQRFVPLDLVERVRSGFGDPASGEVYKTRRAFFDFVVGGVSLYEVAGESRDCVSVIWAEPPFPTEQAKAIRRLLVEEPADAPDRRVSLYVCPECGDLGCGAITIQVDEMPDEIIWRDFGFENSYEPSVDRSAFRSIGPFHFERRKYEAQLRAFLFR